MLPEAENGMLTWNCRHLPKRELAESDACFERLDRESDKEKSCTFMHSQLHLSGSHPESAFQYCQN